MLATTYSTSVLAAQFESVIYAVASPEIFKSSNGWADSKKIKGVEWDWPYYKSATHDHTMVGSTKVGKDKNSAIGETTVFIEGNSSYIKNVNIYIGLKLEAPSKKAINHFFGEGKVEKIPTDCDAYDGTGPNATYYFKKVGYQPVFIRMSNSIGTRIFTTSMSVSDSLSNLDDC